MNGKDRVVALTAGIQAWWDSPAWDSADPKEAAEAHRLLASAFMDAICPDWQFEETGEAKPVPGSLVDASMDDPAVGTVKVARDLLSRIDDDPWDWKRGHVYRPNAGDESDRKYYGGALVCESVKANNAAFIAKAPALVTVLCREVERLVREKAAMQTESDRHLKARAWAEAELATARERNAELENELADAKAKADDLDSQLGQALPLTQRVLGAADHESASQAAYRVVRERDDARWLAEEAWRWIAWSAKQLDTLTWKLDDAVTQLSTAQREIAEAFRHFPGSYSSLSAAVAVLKNDHAGEIVRLKAERDDVRKELKGYREALSDADAELSDVGWRDSVVHGIRLLKSAHEKGLAKLRADLEDWRNKALEANREAWTAKQRLKSIVACAAADGEKGGAE